MSYTDLDKKMGLKLRDHLKIAESGFRMDGDGKPVTMDYIHAAHELIEELRKMGEVETRPTRSDVRDLLEQFAVQLREHGDWDSDPYIDKLYNLFGR